MKHVKQVKFIDGVWQLVENAELNKVANEGTILVESSPNFSNCSTKEMIRLGAVPVAEEIEEFERENGI